MTLPADPAKWPLMWAEALEERAAIVEFMGRQPKAEAWRMAVEMVRKEAAGVRP